MRRFRRTHRVRSSKRRQTFWDGVHVAGPLSGFLLSPGTDSSVYSFWARWPAGMIEPTTATGIVRSGLIQPIDVTLERTRVLWSLTMTGLTAGTAGTIAVGLQVFETRVPENFDNVIFDGNPPEVADPAQDLNEDWLFRSVGPFTAFTTAIFINNGSQDIDGYQSRAKRKLRAGQGILASLAITCSEVDETAELSFAEEVRMLLKQGEYRT